MQLGLTQNNTLLFSHFPQAKTSKKNVKKRKIPIYFALTLSSSSTLHCPAQSLNWGSYYFPRSFRGFILCFVPSWHTVHGQTWREQQTFAPLGQTESSTTPFYSILNLYIRSESVLSRPPDFRISRASKMLNADSVFTWVCEAGRVRVICSYLIFLPLSHLQCGFGELICSQWFSLPSSRAEMSFISTCLLMGELSWKHHVNHCTGVQRGFFPSTSPPTDLQKDFMVWTCLTVCLFCDVTLLARAAKLWEKQLLPSPPFPFSFLVFYFHLPPWVSGSSLQPRNRQLCSLYLCVCLTFLPRRFVYQISTSLRKSWCHRPYGSFL